MLTSTQFFKNIQGEENATLQKYCYILNTFTVIYFKKSNYLFKFYIFRLKSLNI